MSNDYSPAPRRVYRYAQLHPITDALIVDSVDYDDRAVVDKHLVWLTEHYPAVRFVAVTRVLPAWEIDTDNKPDKVDNLT